MDQERVEVSEDEVATGKRRCQLGIGLLERCQLGTHVMRRQGESRSLDDLGLDRTMTVAPVGGPAVLPGDQRKTCPTASSVPDRERQEDPFRFA